MAYSINDRPARLQEKTSWLNYKLLADRFCDNTVGTEISDGELAASYSRQVYNWLVIGVVCVAAMINR
jgi:hypothetical protein